ncbi:MAG: ABC transporter permease [Defluviitaleaceae bacterium]|nr:ABC transporter permease [Defluviitaleaceae bacterium]
MIGFLLKKMLKNKWLMLCLITGNILLIGIAAAAPMYSMATMTRMLHQEMRLVQINELRFPAVSRLSYSMSVVVESYNIYLMTRGAALPRAMDALAVPVAETIQTYRMGAWRLFPAEPRSNHVPARITNLWGIGGAFENIEIVYGRMPSEEMVEGNVIEALALEMTLFNQDILYYELLSAPQVYDDDLNLYVRVVGIFRIPAEATPFWSEVGFGTNNDLLISHNLIRERFLPNYHNGYNMVVTWINIHDFEAMSAARSDLYMNGITSQREFFDEHIWWDFDENFYGAIYAHAARVDGFNITLLILQIPLYLLLAFYIYVVSRKILQLEQNDISVLKSRGVSRKQIFMLYIMQSLFVGIIAFPTGIVFGRFVCQMLGASSGFLELVQRAPLMVELSSQAILFGGLAFAFSFLVMFLPVIGFSRIDITDHKRGKAQALQKPLWQRFFLDVICLGAAIYGVYNFNIQQELIEETTVVIDWIDPMLFLLSSLFMIGLGLFCLRIFPYFVKLIFILGKRWWPPFIYASLLRVTRSAREEQFIMVFLVFTLAIGVYSAQTARTINLNAEHEVRFIGGADLVFREHWRNNAFSVVMGHAEQMRFDEPDFRRFTGFEEVEAITRVLRTPVNLTPIRAGQGQPRERVTMMAIEPQTFADTIWFRDDLLPIHINRYLNVLSQTPNGAILSANFRDLGYRVGQTVDISHARNVTYTLYGQQQGAIILSETSVVVVGFADVWPTFVPQIRQELPDGRVIYRDEYLIVTNRGYISQEWGVWPYHVWMRTNTDTNRFFYDFRAENDLRINYFNDTWANIVDMRQDPLLQGTNGALTMNFIAALLICFTGFLIYWILSVKERMLQFGIFRAMGMGTRGIVGILINEQFFITLTALLIGAVVGEVSARLFVPLIKLAYSDQLIPLMVVMEPGDYANMYMVLGIMIVLCVALLIAFISRIRIDQALKLGED